MKILVIGDTQCKPDISLDYMSWIGRYIVDKRPDVVVHIGDHYDMPSLSSYDKGKRSFEGRRVGKDIDAGKDGLQRLVEPLKQLQERQVKNKKKVYSPRLIVTLGNHESRLDRFVEDNPEFHGLLGVEHLPFAEYGFEVVPFLQPIEVEGIHFVHYLANPMSGKPYSGTAANILKNVGCSFVMGHRQVLDYARRSCLNGKSQIGIIIGACYMHEEEYKGKQGGNDHFRGIVMLNEVKDGCADPMFVSLEYLKKKYGGVQ